MIFDLHSHSVFSDGVLTPEELVLRAKKNRVDVLAITDHDTLDAYQNPAESDSEITLITGIELSTQWETTGIHVIGLNINSGSDSITTGVRFQANAREQRARLIGERLEKKGIKDAYDGASQLSRGRYIGRPHFAQYLINIGKADSMHTAFRKYMGDGKTGDVKQHWAELPRIIQWIRGANGIAVLAHPLKYKLTRTRLKRLIADFIKAGGQGIEVISGQQQVQQTRDIAQLCEQNKLLASCGSDFHMPGRPWADLGKFAALPSDLTPVWEQF